MLTEVYPKRYLQKNNIVEDNQCFIAMPFSEDYTNLYNTLKDALEDKKYKCIRADENSEASVPLISLILKGIACSQCIIVDITEVNANVFYELGIAHTIKDYQNVFILKENSAKVPFDISHLKYIAYDKKNLKALANTIIKHLDAIQYVSKFKQLIVQKQFVNYFEIDDFISYFSTLFEASNANFNRNLIDEYTQLLSNTTETHKDEIVSYIFEYDKVLQNELKNNISSKFIPALFKILFELLLLDCNNHKIQEYVKNFLEDDTFGNLTGSLFLGYKTDLAIRFAEESKLCDITLKWIIEYFKRSKSTRIDLNRYKLEAFLLKNNSSVVKDYLINAILSENNYIREHIADIIGEKKLYEAQSNLITQLQREQNVYTVSSIMEALGKIKSIDSIKTIQERLESYADKQITGEHYHVFKHAYNALQAIGDSNALTDFSEKYLDILKKENMV